MISCIVIDDEPLARELLRSFIEKTPDFKLEGSFSSALKSLADLNRKKIDVIFLDIQMPDMTGLDFLRTLKKKPLVVLTTAHADYALEGFELDVVDYLLKPFDFSRYLKSVNKIMERINHGGSVGVVNKEARESRDFIFVKDGTRLVKISLPNILFIKGTREYVTIHTSEKKIMTLQTLKSLEEELPEEFARVHNSFIVYIPAVDAVSKNEIEIQGETIPIGISYKKQFLGKLEKYFPGRKID